MVEDWTCPASASDSSPPPLLLDLLLLLFLRHGMAPFRATYPTGVLGENRSGLEEIDELRGGVRLRQQALDVLFRSPERLPHRDALQGICAGVDDQGVPRRRGDRVRDTSRCTGRGSRRGCPPGGSMTARSTSSSDVMRSTLPEASQPVVQALVAAHVVVLQIDGRASGRASRGRPARGRPGAGGTSPPSPAGGAARAGRPRVRRGRPPSARRPRAFSGVSSSRSTYFFACSRYSHWSSRRRTWRPSVKRDLAAAGRGPGRPRAAPGPGSRAKVRQRSSSIILSTIAVVPTFRNVATSHMFASPTITCSRR